MKKLLCCLLFITAVSIYSYGKYNVMIAPGTISESGASILWDKQYGEAKITYLIYLNGRLVDSTFKTNYTFDSLLAYTTYTASITTDRNLPKRRQKLNMIKFVTAAKGKIFNVTHYGAAANSMQNNTAAIQAAINACSPGGTVYIPAGRYITGALYLKSNMTLFIEKGGVLKGSDVVEDYLPMILNRFEGWELKTYASLLNGGTLNRNGSYNIKNVRITGGGTISGGGRKLGEAMIKANGMRSRGRLICLMNGQDIEISNLLITEPPSWTIHYIYSDNITCRDLTIITTNIRNGDGLDPDSSTDSYIFNCTFDTGDDCIAIKSGKNPEGFFIAKPTKNVRITNCDFKRGHGISIGSEMSGGVSDVLVQDCNAGALLHGMQIKGTKDRGGYVKNITVTDCALLQITIFSAVNYNNDGEPAPQVPTFANFLFKNLDLSNASDKQPVININGFNDARHKLKNVRFEHIAMPDKAKIMIRDSEDVMFKNVLSKNGTKPIYDIATSSNIIY